MPAKIAFPSLFAAALLACSPANTRSTDHRFSTPVFEATTPDGQLEFTMEEGMARGAFQEFCQRSPAEACDDFEAYKIQVALGDDLTGMPFIHRDHPSDPPGKFHSIVCGYVRGQRECQSGVQF